MSALRNKVSTTLNIVYQKCKQKKPFSMAEVLKFVEVSRNLAVIIRTNGIIEKQGKGEGGATNYKWMKSAPNDEMIDVVYKEMQAYNAKMNEKTKQKTVVAELPAQQDNPAPIALPKDVVEMLEQMSATIVSMNNKITELHNALR